MIGGQVEAEESSMTVRIYHNPRCSKSRQTLELLRERGIEPEIVEYLEQPPDAGALLDLAAQLGVSVRELLRTGESEYRDARQKVDAMEEAALASWLSRHPRVMQRPIVVTPRGARIGRPPETVLEVLG